MIRLFTKNATGVAPDGKWYAGDVNAIMDAVAALNDLTQALGLQSLAIGEPGLQLLRYSPGEARLSGALRVDKILRGLGGLYAGAFTAVQRDAIPLGSRPYGLIITNSDANRLEWNAGSDSVPSWQPLAPPSPTTIIDTKINRPAPGTVSAGTRFFATDQVAEWVCDGAAWIRIGKQPGEVGVNLTAVATYGCILLQGQAWPSTGGIYSDLYARLGSPANVPDFSMFAPVGFKAGDDTFGALLATVGEKKHVLTAAEMQHDHQVNIADNGDVTGAGTGPRGSTYLSGGVHDLAAIGHNNVQPSKVVNFEAKL